MSSVKYVIVVCLVVWFTSARDFNELNEHYQKIKNEPVVVQWMDLAKAKCGKGRRVIFAEAAVKVAEKIDLECEAEYPTDKTFPHEWNLEYCKLQLLDRNLGCAHKCFVDKLTNATGLPFNKQMVEQEEGWVLFDENKMSIGAINYTAKRWVQANYEAYKAQLTHGTCEFWGCQSYYVSLDKGMNTYGLCIRKLLAKDVDLFP